MSKTEKRFKNIFKGKVVIVGIGNRLRGDDGFGSALIKKLEGRVNAVCFDVGSAPENYAEKIARLKPDTILIADAVHLGLEPGEYEVLSKSEIVECGFTTHNISPKMFIEYLAENTEAKIYMLGVQPTNLSFGEEMSPEVKKAVDKISQFIISSF